METVMADVRDLRGKDYARVKYPADLAALVREAQSAWQAFYLLPQEMKESFGYLPDGDKSGVGYQGPGRDPKEHFHARLSEKDWLREQALRLDNEIVTAFLEKTLQLLERMPSFMEQEFLESAEAEFGILGLTRKAMAASDLWTIRFLHYLEGCGADATLAAEHWDKGTATAHLYENAPGFERFTLEGDWEPVSFGDGETLIIAGLGLQYLSECKLRAMGHRVMADTETGEVGRDSIVCFFDHEGQVYYNKEEHGPTQELMKKHGPGFFYGMPFSEYQRYFRRE